VFIFPVQNAGQNRSIHIPHNFFKMWPTLKDQNYVREGINSNLNSGIACYNSVKNFLSSRLHIRNEYKVEKCKSPLALFFVRYELRVYILVLYCSPYIHLCVREINYLKMSHLHLSCGWIMPLHCTLKKTFFYLDLLERGHVEGYFYSLFVGNSTVLPPLFRCCWHVLICCNFADVASTMESDKGTSGRPDWTDNNM